eukprot:gene15660-15807_t
MRPFAWKATAGRADCLMIERRMPLFVVTATRLRDGAILWLGADHVWHERFAAANPVPEAEIDAELAFGASEIAAQRVIGVYRVEVERDGFGFTPVTTRERIRATGPSVRPDLSYAQAQAGGGV